MRNIRRLLTAYDYAISSFTPGRPLLEAAMELTTRIHRDFRYVPGATDVFTSTADLFARRQGVCQDFAHLEITCLRTLGLAARYVSGYLLTDPPPGQPKLIGADASHAWLALYCPGVGWLEFDPTFQEVVLEFPQLAFVLEQGEQVGDLDFPFRAWDSAGFDDPGDIRSQDGTPRVKQPAHGLRRQ